MAQDDHSGTELAAADSSHAAHESSRVDGHGGRSRPTRSRTPASRRTVRASPTRTPSARSARAHGLHALLPVDPRQRLGRRGLHALPDRVERRRRGAPEQHVHRPRRDARTARPRLRRGALGQVAHGRRRARRRASPDRRLPRDAGRRGQGLRRRRRGVRLHPSLGDPQQPHRRAHRLPAARRRALPRLRPAGPAPRRAAQPHHVGEGHASRARPVRRADQGRRRHASAARSTSSPRAWPSSSTASSRRRPRRPSSSCASSRASSTRHPTASPGRTTASSPTPRSARTSDAPWRCTSSTRTTCSARATSRSSTWRTTARSSSARPSGPLPQLPIAVDDEGYLIAQSDFNEPVGPSFWERH